MKRFELKKKDWLDTSVFRIALVENPAIETDFIFLSKEDHPIQLSVQDEKRMIYSPVLIPDKVIPRVSESGEEYEIFFSGDTIEEIAKDYMLKKATLGEWNSEHNENELLSGVDVIENWIVENPANDKATELGFKVPAKTWMQGTYISNEKVWSDIKSGKYKGVSVEADMSHELINLKNANEMSETNRKLDSILARLGRVIPTNVTKLASMEVGEGLVIYADSFEEGARVYADEAMTVPAEGSFEIEGKTFTVEGGVLVSVTEAAPEAEPEVALEEAPVDEEKKEELAEAPAEEVADSVKEEVAEAVVEEVKESIEDIVAGLVSKSEAMKKENEDLRSALSEVNEKLSAIETLTSSNTEKLSKVSTIEPKSVTLTATSSNNVANYFNNRKNY
tara:strand:+ start:4384 stop:5559 length:1176 start_codon:yes stop_codon:yes gene_type:complete